MKFKRHECSLRLCDTPCVEVCHTKLHFRGSADTKIEKQNTKMSLKTTTDIALTFFDSIFLMR